MRNSIDIFYFFYLFIFFFFVIAYSTCMLEEYGKHCSASTQYGTHIRAHIITQVHLCCNHLEPGYHGDI
ncbi:hypothetical protein E2C01_076803 [Portunus trituberculatus]|uniref:Uncharacterized protein n=1 Tax=Portunus trituberculatus TaxID=210409 RepID=A0A5B7IIP8_PORTR|nr:hypothetical protein [Portunus trituberculatus]